MREATRRRPVSRAARRARARRRWPGAPTPDPSALNWPEMSRSDTVSGSLPLLFYADGYKFPDVYHVTRFLAPDPIIALEQNGEVVIVANSLEEGRARKESRAREVFNIDDFGAKEISKTATSREELDAEVIRRFLES